MEVGDVNICSSLEKINKLALFHDKALTADVGSQLIAINGNSNWDNLGLLGLLGSLGSLCHRIIRINTIHKTSYTPWISLFTHHSMNADKLVQKRNYSYIHISNSSTSTTIKLGFTRFRASRLSEFEFGQLATKLAQCQMSR